MKNQKTLDKVLSTINEATNGYYLSYQINDILKEDKLDISFIANNFDYFIMHVNGNHFARFLNYISLQADLSDNILKKIPTFMKKFKTGDISDKCQETFLEMLTFQPGYKKIFQKNMRIIIESFSPSVLFEKGSLLKEISPRYTRKINDIINLNQDKICKHILIRCLSKNNNQGNITLKDLNDYSLTLQILFREVLKSEGKQFSDVEKIGEGAFSQTFRVGNKVIKVGAPRETYNIPNHRRILQPLARVNLTGQNHNSIGTIEVTDEVDTSNSALNKITKDDLYMVYKELRDSGIVWGDPKIDNLGILKRENIPTMGGKPFHVNSTSIGFMNNLDGVKPLNKGDIVIVDTDFLYRQEQKNKRGNSNSFILEYEKRYQEEKRKKAQENSTNKKDVYLKNKDDDLDY